MRAPFAKIVCVRGMANLVEHWFNLLYRVHADNSTDARSQDCDPFLRANNKKKQSHAVDKELYAEAKRI